jgi:hypothetical protein
VGSPAQISEAFVLGRAEAQAARQFSGVVLTFAALLPNASAKVQQKNETAKKAGS